MDAKGGRFDFSIVLILLALAAIVAYRYVDYVAQRHYVLNVQVACDPSLQTCFVSDCSPETDAGCDTSPYAKVTILASQAPSCLEEHSCESFSCRGLSSCSIAYCDTSSLDTGEKCSVAPVPDAAPATTTATTTP